MSVNTQLRLYENRVFLDKTNNSGIETAQFYIVSGSRVLITLKATAVDIGATASLEIENGFSENEYELIETLQLTAAGAVKRVYSDFNNLFRLKVTVSGGNASYKVAVAVFDNASTTRIDNAQIDVSLDHTVDVLGHFDSVRIGDGEDLLEINPDGSINTQNQVDPDEEVINEYDELPAHPTGTDSPIVSYTVPADKIAWLYHAEGSGENVARYQIKVNGSVIATRRTYFGGDLTTDFDFTTSRRKPLEFEEGDIIQLFVLHNRPNAGDFEGRLELILKPVP